jgi:thiazole/oxazole-forming peptide maturase SagC family component
MAHGDTPAVYRLADGVRIHRSGHEVRFRRGVWSHQEATLRLVDQPAPVVQFVNAVCDALTRDGVADPELIARELAAGEEEVAQYRGLLESLAQRQFLSETSQQHAARMVASLLGGGIGGFEQRIAAPRPALFFTDSEYARTSATALAREIGLPLDVMDAELLRELAAADLTSRTDAVDYIDTLSRYEKIFRPYSCVVGCVASPNLSTLRNLNRLLLQEAKPLILGLIDGPFITALSSLGTETGCFECFEQRMLARLEDTAAYQQFVDATARREAPAGGAWAASQLHALISVVVSEAYLYSSIGMMRLAGRIVNVYLPLLEIQVQDLLRVPYCPACGYVARGQMNEMYTSTKRLVSDMLGRIAVEG